MGKYALIIVLTLFLTANYLVLSNNRAAETALDQTMGHFFRRQAQNIANSHVNIALEKVHRLYDPQEDFDPEDYNYEMELDRYGNASVIVTVSQTANFGEFMIVSQAETNGYACTSTVYDQLIPFSYYAWFLDNWPRYYLGNGEGVTGPFHSNSYFHIGQNPGPTISGNATCVRGVRWYNGANPGNYEGFQGDNNNFNHPPIEMPLDVIDNIDTARAYDLDTAFSGAKDLWVELGDNSLGEGVVRIWEDSAQNDPQRFRSGHASDEDYQNWLDDHYLEIRIADLSYPVIYSEQHNLHLQGVLNGTLSVATKRKIIMDDDVVLKDDPRVNPESEDVLGLFADQGFIISSDEMPHNPGQYYNEDGCFIMANLFTPGTIQIEHLSKWKGPTNRGEFRVYGSRTQDVPSATWSGGWNYRGFKEFIEYDTRFRKIAPPGVPMTSQRKITRWTETF